jgi:uroporphyrinogen decarboxylase
MEPSLRKIQSLFLRACFSRPVERAPVWIMRQAGRYLPQYRRIREKTSFLNLCKTPELAAEVTLQPVEILGVDAAIIFSDILLVPEAMGLKLSIEENEGPRLSPAIRDVSDIRKLTHPVPEKAYDFLGEAMGFVRRSLNGTPLIGFAGSPWTLMVYMVEGGVTRDFVRIKRFVYDQKKAAHQLLTRIADAVTDSLNFQIESGAQAVQIFDSWGGILGPADFREFSLAYVERILGGLRRKNIPVILFAKGTGSQLERIARCGADVVSLDWTVDLTWARKILKGRVALQGNLDPCMLYCSPKRIQEAVRETLQKVNPQRGYIFNLGHGILPDTPVENVKYLVKCVKELSSK